MECLRRKIVQRVVPVLAGLLLCASIVAGFDHNHRCHVKGPDENPCCACNLELLLGGCDGAVPDLHALDVAQAFLTPDMPDDSPSGSQYHRLACGLRAPPAA
jgi:hypothetical protein